MLLSISILLYGKAEITAQCLKALEAILKDRGDVKTIIRNNASPDNGESETAVFQCGLRNLIYCPCGKNLGFGQGHNENLLLAKDSKYFMVMNNDLILQDSRAIEKIISPLDTDPEVALVGLEGAPCSLRPDGSGFRGTKVEYIEGSLLAGRTEDFLTYGLFNPMFPMYFFEDSDLSLRFRQMGKKISAVYVAHTHVRSQSFNLVDRGKREAIFHANHVSFKKRWANYLTTRQFSNRILVKMESLGIGDIISMTPVLEGVRKDHPTATIEVVTSYPDIFIGNPHLSELYQQKREYTKAYDRIIDLKPLYSSRKSISKQVEEIAGTKLDSYKPQIFLTALEIKEGRKIVNSVREYETDVVAGVSLQMQRVVWQGRNWSHEHLKVLIEMLRESGIKVIEFGHGVRSTELADLDLVDAISLREYFSIVASLDIFLTIDSLGLHVAQAFSVPTFALFGATDPIARVVNWDSVFPITNGICCQGCYQERGPQVPDVNRCFLGTEECMGDITPEMVMEKLGKSRDELLKQNIAYLRRYVKGE